MQALKEESRPCALILDRIIRDPEITLKPQPRDRVYQQLIG